MRLKAWFVLTALVLAAAAIQQNAAFDSSSSSSRRQTSPEAYVTLLYGDEFLLGVRVLGKSIRDTGSTKDMVALVSDGVSNYAMKLLQADGWIVEKISLLANPNQVRPTRFWGVYTKLKIFNMTNYKKVVYLDADTIVVKSIEDLFKCSKFCANLKHSERLNSGVMVVEPSETLFNDMMRQVTTLPSYTGGDQGFLNSYYSDFPNAHVFEPNLSQEVRKSRPVPKMERLSTLYNADVGLYMLANKWMVDESELHVIHYTLGPLKPWDWWTSWLLKPVDVWQTKVPVYLGGISIVVCFMAALVALALSLAIVPRQVMPWTGLLLMYEWTFTIFFILFGGYLHLIYQWGKTTAVQAGTSFSGPESVDYDSGKGHQRQASLCDNATFYYGLGMAFLAVAAPALPCLFGITALFLRLGLMVVGGLVLASFMTYASEHLATRSFLRGFEDRDATRSRRLCLFC